MYRPSGILSLPGATKADRPGSIPGQFKLKYPKHGIWDVVLSVT